MNGSQNWVEAWKARAEVRRQTLAQALTRKPINPAVASIRELYIKRAQNAVSARKSWAEAYLAHVKGLHSIISNQSVGSASSTGNTSSSTKGSLGDAG